MSIAHIAEGTTDNPPLNISVCQATVASLPEQTLAGSWSGSAFTAPSAANVVFWKIGQIVFWRCDSTIAAGAGGTDLEYTLQIPAAYTPAASGDSTSTIISVPCVIDGEFQTNPAQLNFDGSGHIFLTFPAVTAGVANGFPNLAGSYNTTE
jgi:hypothetical protein